MRILSLSDRVVDFIYSPSLVDRFGEVELIVGCGDLPAYYLEYVISMLNVPMVYVPGNHDLDDLVIPGGQCIDGKLINVRGIWIAGLGGSRRYKSEGKHQYTEGEMQYRVFKLSLSVLMRVRLFGRRLDLFVSHSPPLGIHDKVDLPHKGFTCFHSLLRMTKPRLMLHGHSHVLRNIEKTRTKVYDTEIVNVYPYRVLNLQEEG